jgi:hypothetical protein
VKNLSLQPPEEDRSLEPLVGSSPFASRDESGAQATAAPAVPVESFRFPCGHLEPRPTVEGRIRFRSSAAWVACAECELIALVVTPKTATDRQGVTR